MKLNRKGQVTIPAELRHRHGFVVGDEVDVVEEGNTLRIVHRPAGKTHGAKVVDRMRGRAVRAPSTDQLMELLRCE